jgi:hypothetical protein
MASAGIEEVGANGVFAALVWNDQHSLRAACLESRELVAGPRVTWPAVRHRGDDYDFVVARTEVDVGR